MLPLDMDPPRMSVACVAKLVLLPCCSSTVGALGATLAACTGSAAAASPGGTEELVLGSLMLVGQVLAYSLLMIKQR